MNPTPSSPQPAPPALPVRSTLVGSFLATAVVAVALAAPVVGWRHRLPDSLATHWGVNGTANGSMSGTALVITGLVGFLIPVVVFAVLAWRAPHERLGLITSGAVAAMFAILFPLVTLSTAFANLDATDWHTVRGPAVWAVAGSILLALAAGVVAAAWLGRAIPLVPVPSSESATPLVLAPGERAVWIGRCTSWWLIVPSAGLGIAGLAAFALHLWWVGVAAVVLAMVTSALCHITVVVDGRGLRIRYGVLGWPSTKVSLERIAGVSSIEVRPMEWGGWGYRGSLRLFRQAAVVLRKGPGIRLELADQRTFAVTVDDAETGAALLEALRTRAAAPTA